MNKVRSTRSGYTIVETMIFLAVSGALFLSAMLLVNGQQSKTEFTTMVRDFDTKLQSVIGNVSAGYYNNPGAVSCDVGVSGDPEIHEDITSNQGTNAGCVFVGQFIDINSTSDGFTITSHAGLRLKNGTEEATNLTDTRHVAITKTAEDYNLLPGVKVKIRVVNGDTGINRIAITPSFASNAGTGLLNSGASTTEIHAFTSSGNETVNPKDGIQICLVEDPGNDNAGQGQTGLILLTTGSTRVTTDNAKGACPWIG